MSDDDFSQLNSVIKDLLTPFHAALRAVTIGIETGVEAGLEQLMPDETKHPLEDALFYVGYFYNATLLLLDLLSSSVDVPANEIWQRIALHQNQVTSTLLTEISRKRKTNDN